MDQLLCAQVSSLRFAADFPLGRAHLVRKPLLFIKNEDAAFLLGYNCLGVPG